MLIEKVNADTALAGMPFADVSGRSVGASVPVLATPATAAAFCPGFVAAFKGAAAGAAAFTAGFTIGQAIG
jgi:hypothetical protein